MKYLSSCPKAPAEYVTLGKYRGAIVDPRSGQRLEFASDEPFVALTLDSASVEWGTGKKPDGLVVADLDGIVWMCFIEIKGKNKTPQAFAQLDGGVNHFAPTSRAGGERGHGDDHHDLWSSDEFGMSASKDHRVVGLFVTFRSLPRLPPEPPQVVAGKAVVKAAIQVMKIKPNRAEVSPRDLLRKAGLLSAP